MSFRQSDRLFVFGWAGLTGLLESSGMQARSMLGTSGGMSWVGDSEQTLQLNRRLLSQHIHKDILKFLKQSQGTQESIQSKLNDLASTGGGDGRLSRLRHILSLILYTKSQNNHNAEFN